MVSFEEFLSAVVWNNTGREYLVALSVFVGLFILLKIFDSVIIRVLRKAVTKTKIKWDDLAVDFLSAIHWHFYAYISFYIASLTLALPAMLDKGLYYLLIIFVAFYVAQGFSNSLMLFSHVKSFCPFDPAKVGIASIFVTVGSKTVVKVIDLTSKLPINVDESSKSTAVVL